MQGSDSSANNCATCALQNNRSMDSNSANTLIFSCTDMSSHHNITIQTLTYQTQKRNFDLDRAYFTFIMAKDTIDDVTLASWRWIVAVLYATFEFLYVFFRYTLLGYRLPPRPGAFKILKWTQKYGMFNNHRMTAASFDWTGSKIVSIVVPGMPLAVIINDVKLVEEVMTNKALYNSRGWTGFNVWVPQGLLALPTGEQWAMHRRLITKFLSTNYLRNYADVVVDKTKKLLQTWRDEASDNGEPQDVQEYLAMCTLDIISLVAFGCELAVEGQGKQLKQAVNIVLEETALRTREGPLRTLLSWKRRQRFQESLGWLQNAILDASLRNPHAHLMKTGKTHGEVSQDHYADNILGLLRKTQASGTEVLTEDEIIQEVMTIAGAGHETTANTLSWALLLLAEYPTVQAKLQAHVDAGVQGEVATFEEAHRLVGSVDEQRSDSKFVHPHGPGTIQDIETVCHSPKILKGTLKLLTRQRADLEIPLTHMGEGQC